MRPAKGCSMLSTFSATIETGVSHLASHRWLSGNCRLETRQQCTYRTIYAGDPSRSQLGSERTFGCSSVERRYRGYARIVATRGSIRPRALLQTSHPAPRRVGHRVPARLAQELEG